MTSIRIASYIAIALHFLRLAVNKLQAGKIHGAIKVDRKKYPYFIMFPYRIGNTLRAIVAYHRDIHERSLILNAALLPFPTFCTLPIDNCLYATTPEEYFKKVSHLPSINLDKSFHDAYLTASEAKAIIESIKNNSGTDTVTDDIILVPLYQPSKPDFYIPPAGTELRQMPGNANSIRYAAYAPKPDSEMVSADGLVHYH